jgi:DNA-binding response OmpR family regulator
VDTAIEQTIVIIDDEDEIRTLMEFALARPGRAVVGFADSSEALAFLREDRPVDVIISDVRMAGLDGYALVQRLQERAETAGTPVIFVSANDAADQQLSANGVEIEFLRKPFEIAELRARVDAAVARRSEPALDFDAILSGAVARAGKSERPMSLLLVATVPPLQELSAQRARSTAHSIAGVVRAHLRRSDEAAMFVPYACAASLDGCPPQRAREIASAIAADLHTRTDALGVEVQVGLGCASDCRALTFRELLGAAQTAVEEAAVCADRFAMREVAS